MRKSELINRKAFSLRTFKPQGDSERLSLREKITQDTDEFLRGGGKIVHLESFESRFRQYEELTPKERFNRIDHAKKSSVTKKDFKK